MLDRTTHIENEIPVVAYNEATDKMVGEYPSISKALKGLGIYNIRPKSVLLSRKKNGKLRILECKKLNINIYLKIKK